MAIADDLVENWLRDGYVIVPNFLTTAEIGAVRAEALHYVPTWDEYETHPRRYKHLLANGPVYVSFPFTGPVLNAICTCPDILDFVTRALGTPDIFMTQSHLWAKYAGTGDFDQELHVDYGRNSLAYPRDDGSFRQIPIIVYYTDVTLDLGPTYVVPQDVTEHHKPVPRKLTRESDPVAYTAEIAVTVPAGTLLIYGMRTFHRGSAMTATRGMRLTHHIVYRAAGYEWMGWRAWPRSGRDPEMRSFIESASPRQRAAIGFPALGDPYWNEETLAGVAARYPGMDLAPYAAALLSNVDAIEAG